MASKDTNPPLGDQINRATRSVHTKLNRLIILRLPMALPPIADNPFAYVSGLIHVAPIYIAFESLWENILRIHEENAKESGDCGHDDGYEPGNPLLDSQSMTLLPFRDDTDVDKLVHRPASCERIHSVLTLLRLEGLDRSTSLRADIRAITGWSEEVANEEIELAAKSGRLNEFICHIKRSVGKNPHVLLAYAWVLYMALFSGGRILRRSLELAGYEFWSRVSSPVQPSGRACKQPFVDSSSPPPQGLSQHQPRKKSRSDDSYLPDDSPERSTSPFTVTAPLAPAGNAPLAFFRFDTPEDGEDLKKEFKQRLTDAEALLTHEEREDIVQEAVCVFDNMILLVNQLDRTFGTDELEEGVHAPQPVTDSLPSSGNFSKRAQLGRRIRDSVAVAKERGMKAALEGALHGTQEEPDWESEQEGRNHQCGVNRKHKCYYVERHEPQGHAPPTASRSVTGTSGLTAQNTLTRSAERSRRTSMVYRWPESDEKATAAAIAEGTAPRTHRVRFDPGLLSLSETEDADVPPEKSDTETGQSELQHSGNKMNSFLTLTSPAMWNILLFLGFSAVLFGIGQAQVWG